MLKYRNQSSYQLISLEVLIACFIFEKSIFFARGFGFYLRGFLIKFTWYLAKNFSANICQLKVALTTVEINVNFVVNFVVNFECISHLFQLHLYLTLSLYVFAGLRFVV